MEKNNKNYIEDKIQKKLFLVCFCILLVFFLSACGHTASKSSLLAYAKKTYGKCKLLSEEHSGKGKDEIRILYLKDVDTGLEYSLTSKMVSQGLDGAEFISFEQKSSDFNEKYKNYIYELAGQELSKPNTVHPAKIMLSESLSNNKIIFDNRTSDDDSKIVCKKIANIIASNDKKKYLSIDFLVYCENKEICTGYYDYSSDTFESNEPYTVIDYVYEKIDKDAKYLFSLSGTLDAYLSYEDLEEIDPNNTKRSTYGNFYFFLSSTGVEFVSFNMKEFGMSGVYCVSKESREQFTLSPSLQ